MTDAATKPKKPTQAEINALTEERLRWNEVQLKTHWENIVGLWDDVDQLKKQPVKPPSKAWKWVVENRTTVLFCVLAAYIVISPFVFGGRSIQPFPGITQGTSITSIVKSSPKDREQRKHLVTGFREVAESITNREVTNLEQAKAKTMNQTNHILILSAGWETVGRDLWTILNRCKDVSEYGDKCTEIANAFESF